MERKSVTAEPHQHQLKKKKTLFLFFLFRQDSTRSQGSMSCQINHRPRAKVDSTLLNRYDIRRKTSVTWIGNRQRGSSFT